MILLLSSCYFSSFCIFVSCIVVSFIVSAKPFSHLCCKERTTESKVRYFVIILCNNSLYNTVAKKVMNVCKKIIVPCINCTYAYRLPWNNGKYRMVAKKKRKKEMLEVSIWGCMYSAQSMTTLWQKCTLSISIIYSTCWLTANVIFSWARGKLFQHPNTAYQFVHGLFTSQSLYFVVWSRLALAKFSSELTVVTDEDRKTIDQAMKDASASIDAFVGAKADVISCNGVKAVRGELGFLPCNSWRERLVHVYSLDIWCTHVVSQVALGMHAEA